MTDLALVPMARPMFLRILLWPGIVVLLLIGVLATANGLLDLRDSQGLLCCGLGALVGGVGGLAREVVELRVRRHPPRPCLSELDGRPALHLPRASGPALVSSWSLVGFGGVALVGALFVGVGGHPGWSVVLVVVSAWLAWSSAVHRGRTLAGGMWFSPMGMRTEDRGVAVDLGWSDVTGVVASQPMWVMVRPGVLPRVSRTGPRGRAWNPLRSPGSVAIDARHLAGGAALASYVISKAVADPASRHALGTSASPPTL